MSRLLCCLCARQADMGAALSRVQEGEACDGAVLPAAPPTMADVIRERKKKAGGAALGTLRRRLAAAARRPRDARPDRGCEHARFIRSVVSSWRLAEVFLLSEQLEAGAALRDLATQAELAREPAPALPQALLRAYKDRWWCDVELVGAGFSLPAHRCVLAARCSYFRELLQRYPPGACRVPLEGLGASLSREELECGVAALYAGAGLCALCDKYDRGAEGDLDILNVEGSNSPCGCGAVGSGASARSSARRAAALLGADLDALHHDMRYLLDSGELADTRLVFRLESGGAAYGFRAALELPCHRLLLAARSRYFRSVMSRRWGSAAASGSGAPGAVCVDEKVLPRRFARALLHAAYTDQVDLSLIGRSSSSPSSTAGSSAPWSSGSRGRGTSTAMLEDAFQLYEIARFLEMPIVVQGCEDAIAEALSPETLPAVLRWAHAPHASQWVYRQAMRYLRDEFPAAMSHAAAARLPRGALAAALQSPFLQASEAQALRALLRWAERAAPPLGVDAQPPDAREPNVVWHTGGARRARRRSAGDAALREALACLLPHLRLDTLPQDHELLQQLVRRGVVPAPADGAEEERGARAWLARPDRPPRCFLPYLDEIKALLEDQQVPEAELARARRQRYMQRIPDTLYMVRGSMPEEPPAPGAAGAAGGEALCVSGRKLGRLRARVRELRASPAAQRARALHAPDTAPVARQIALRCVRELSLPDACAELLLADADAEPDAQPSVDSCGWARRACGSPLPRPGSERPRWHHELDVVCRSASGSLRYASSGSLRAGGALHGAGRLRRRCGRAAAVGARARRGHGAQRQHAPAHRAALLPAAAARLQRRRAAAGSGRRRHAHAEAGLARGSRNGGAAREAPQRRHAELVSAWRRGRTESGVGPLARTRVLVVPPSRAQSVAAAAPGALAPAAALGALGRGAGLGLPAAALQGARDALALPEQLQQRPSLGAQGGARPWLGLPGAEPGRRQPGSQARHIQVRGFVRVPRQQSLAQPQRLRVRTAQAFTKVPVT